MTMYDIASLWVGPSLTWMEQVCLKSFVDHGHRTVLFCYEPVANVPKGVEVRDANEVYPTDKIIRHERTGSPAFHSDIFRLLLLRDTDFLWVDTDAYCLKPWHKPDHGFFFGWGNDQKRKPYTGVFGLPKDSKTLSSMLKLSQDPYPIPPWLKPLTRAELAEKKASGNPMRAEQLRWGLFGPDALNHFANENGEIKHAMSRFVFYPIPFDRTRVFARLGASDAIHRRVKTETLSIHFYGRRFRNLFAKLGGMPPEGSFMHELCETHDIDPEPTSHLFKLDKRFDQKKATEQES